MGKYVMKSVTQKHTMGCGIACVAYILGKTYAEVLSKTKKKNASTCGYSFLDLVLLLKKFKRNYKICLPGKKVKENTIVFIGCLPQGHYLVKTKKGWMNPWVNHPVISPAKSGFEKKLHGEIAWVICEDKK